MLTYLGKGERSYGLSPISIHSRLGWEFQAVLAGRCSLLLRGQEPVRVNSGLWVFPPSTPHGWGGDGAQTCEVAVFHFNAVPQQVRSLALVRGFLRCGLNRQTKDRLRQLMAALQPERERPTVLNDLYTSWALNELSLIALHEEPARRLHEGDGFARSKADAALAWYSEHLAGNPSLPEVAKAVHSSASHLRRLFQRAHRQSPQAMFARLRFQRACELMADSSRRLDAVATDCGFSSASAFSRAFRAEIGLSPRAWRQRRA